MIAMPRFPKSRCALDGSAPGGEGQPQRAMAEGLAVERGSGKEGG